MSHTLASLKALMLATQRAVAVLQRKRATIDRELARLTGETNGRAPTAGGTTTGAAETVKWRVGRDAPAQPLASWLLAQCLPATIQALAAASAKAGYSGKANAVAAAAKHCAKLKRLPDGRVARRK